MGEVPSMEREKPERTNDHETQSFKEDHPPMKKPSENDYDVLSKDMLEIPYKILFNERKNIAYMRQLNGVKKRAEQVRSEIYGRVDKETKDKDGKKVKVFTNEGAREAETRKRLYVLDEYKRLMSEQRRIITGQRELQAETDFFKHLSDSIKTVTRLNEIKLRIY